MAEGNCRNCGAPVSGHYCRYCGSPTYTPTEAVSGARGKRVHCWYEDGGERHCFDMMLSRVDVSYESVPIYSFDGFYATIPGETRLEMEATMLDFDADAWSEHLRDWGSHG